MNNKTYKVIEDKELSNFDEKRYIVVDVETGKILDNAQGYGYKSIRKAYSAYGYKKRDKSKDKEKQILERKIRNWLLEHKEFEEVMEIEAFEIVKGSYGKNQKFDTAFIKKLLKENNLEPDFSVFDLLKTWLKNK